MKKILQNNEYAEVSYFPEYKLGQIMWKAKHIPSEKYREAFTIATEYAEKNKNSVLNYLSDTTNQGVISPEDRKWFQDEALPRAVESGLKRAASVISGNPFKKYYMNVLIKITKSFEIPLKLFSDYDSALKWLLSFDDYK